MVKSRRVVCTVEYESPRHSGQWCVESRTSCMDWSLAQAIAWCREQMDKRSLLDRGRVYSEELVIVERTACAKDDGVKEAPPVDEAKHIDLPPRLQDSQVNDRLDKLEKWANRIDDVLACSQL